MKKKYVYVLSVDFEGGDGADYFRIGGKDGLRGQEMTFAGMLNLTDPPPKVELLALTQKQWAKAVKVGKERD
jgi:hypothetical protein